MLDPQQDLTAQPPAPSRVVARTESLFVAASPIHGYGVFAARAFDPEELVECCPVIVCPSQQESLLEETELRGHYFWWEDDGLGIALGFGSLYNHAWEPNARYDLDYDLNVVRFYAVRRIAAGEEITVNYTGEPGGRGELWFDSPS